MNKIRKKRSKNRKKRKRGRGKKRHDSTSFPVTGTHIGERKF